MFDFFNPPYSQMLFDDKYTADAIVGAASAGTPGGHVKVFSGADGSELMSFFAFPGFMGGVNVAGEGQLSVFGITVPPKDTKA